MWATRRSIRERRQMPRSDHRILSANEAGVTPLSVGGDHLITLLIFRAIARMALLRSIDAHTDTADEAYNGEKYHHGTPFRRAVEEGLLDPKRVIQIGIRDRPRRRLPPVLPAAACG